MKITHFLKTLLALTFLFILLPTQSQAYGVTDTAVTRLTDTFIMYTISYEFGFTNADLWMPILSTQKPSDTKVNYATTTGKSEAIVLSTAAIVDNMYFVPKGKKSTFTLLVLEETATPSDVHQVSITALPHFIQQEGKKKMLRQLYQSELEHYTTNNK